MAFTWGDGIVIFETKTHDGKRILLHSDEILKTRPQMKSLVVLFGGCSFIPLVWLSPIFLMLVEYDAITHGWLFLFCLMGILIAIPFLFRFLIFTKQYIYAYLLTQLFLCHRINLISSILWFIMANTPIFIGLSFLALCYCEYQNSVFVKRISDKELIRMYRPSFYLDALEENYLFDVSKVKKIKLSDSQKKRHEWLLNIESLGLKLFALCGGGLFLYSFLLRDNFDLRANIIGVIMLFFGLGTREFMLEYAKTKRAIKMKQAGKF